MALEHVADVGSACWISEHGGLQRLCGEPVPDRQGEQVDDFVDVRPDEMGAEDMLAFLLDQDLEAVGRLRRLPSREPR